MIILGLVVSTLLALAIIIINVLEIQSVKAVSIACGIMIGSMSLGLACDVGRKEEVHEQKIESMGSIIKKARADLECHKELLKIAVQNEREKAAKILAEVNQNHAKEIEQIQEKAVVAGLGEWEEEVAVPAQIKKVFRFKNEIGESHE